MAKIKIGLELVPRTCWSSNLRSILTDSEWHQVRTKVKREANHTCVICGAKGNLHAHEEWSYDDKAYIQKLEDIKCICSLCHLVKHYGYAKLQRKDKEALEQLIKLNNCTKEEALEHVGDSFFKWAERSEHKWTLDISNLNKFVVKPKNPFLK